jgi:dienelactone hydrolase
MTSLTRRQGAALAAAFVLHLKGALAQPFRNKQDWRKLRDQVLAGMSEVMGPLPKSPQGLPEVAILEESKSPEFTRTKLTFTSGDGDLVPAYLFVPKKGRGRRQAALCLHQTVAIGKAEPAGLGGKPNLHYASELAERGFVTLAPDYPGYGDYKIDPYAMGYVSATMKGIRNHRRALDLLASMPEVNPRRIGVIGHSLGGHNSLFLAAFDPRVAAVVSSCGFTSFAKYYGGNLTGWSHKGYMPRIASVYEKSLAKMPFDFPGILQSLAPRPVFINAPLRDANFEVTGVDDCVNAARLVYSDVFHASGALRVVHPDCEHDFPPDIRASAYDFLARSL